MGYAMPVQTDSTETYQGLERVVPGLDYLDRGPLSCDACSRSEISDIIEGKSTELVPLYYDSVDGLKLCQVCVDAGPAQD